MLDSLQQFLIAHPILAPLIFVVIRIIPVVFPPIPGILIDAVGIVVFGWFFGFIYGTIGLMLGIMLAFYLGRVFREPLVRKFVPIKKMHEWENSYSEKQKFWALLVARILTASFFDAVSYVIGLTTISTFTFFITTLIVALPTMFLIYYFGDIVVSHTWTVFALTMAATPLIYLAFKLFRKDKQHPKKIDR